MISGRAAVLRLETRDAAPGCRFWKWLGGAAAKRSTEVARWQRVREVDERDMSCKGYSLSSAAARPCSTAARNVVYAARASISSNNDVVNNGVDTRAEIATRILVDSWMCG